MAEQQTKTVRLQRLTGKVSSTHGDKTIRVVVENLVKHARYGKYLKRWTKLAVHDPANEAKVNDTVEIIPCRRISKSKSWRLAAVLRKGTVPIEIANP